ncbi:hypothetical protein J2W92_002308 [Rhizobium leguminosarum]
MRIPALAIILTVVMPSLAFAEDKVSTQLGVILASEQFCGFKYDQAAIRDFINTYVAADDMNFPTRLSGETNLSEINQRGYSPSQKTARCAQVERLAKHYKFIN